MRWRGEEWASSSPSTHRPNLTQLHLSTVKVNWREFSACILYTPPWPLAPGPAPCTRVLAPTSSCYRARIDPMIREVMLNILAVPSGPMK